MGLEISSGVSVAKAWGVDSVTTLVGGYSEATNGFLDLSYAGVGGDISYGEGVIYNAYFWEDSFNRSKPVARFAQAGMTVQLGSPVQSPVVAGISGDVGIALSLSQIMSSESATGFDLGLLGKVFYGAVNIAYGNSFDGVVTEKNIE